MIQRIQSLYLLIVVILMGLMLNNPIISFIIDNKIYDLTAFKLAENNTKEEIFATMPLAIIIIAVALISFLTIFLYKNRKLQMKLTLFNWVLTIGVYVLIFYYYEQAMAIKKLVFAFRMPLIYPLISLILLILAFRGIKKDEEIVQSINHIR